MGGNGDGELGRGGEVGHMCFFYLLKLDDYGQYFVHLSSAFVRDRMPSS